MLRRFIIALVGTVALGSLLIGTGASAAEHYRHHPRHLFLSTGDQCGVVGAISHRCYNFYGDATWPEGLSDYPGCG